MADVRKILILTANMGYGHISASKAIAAALHELYGEACRAEIVNPLDGPTVPPLLRSSSAYDRIVTELPQLYKITFDAGSGPVSGAVIESALTLGLYEAMRDLLESYRPDAIVSTYPYYQAPLGAYFTIRRQSTPLLTVVTDLISVQSIWFNRASDLTLVPTETVYRMALNAGLAEDKLRITGIPVHPALGRSDGSKAERRAALGWQPERTTVLAVGSKRTRSLAAAVDLINHSGLPVQLAVIAGGDEALYSRLQATEWHLPAQMYNFVQNLPEMMHAADAIVCKAGGLIVTESLACGLPLLLVDVLPGQEEGNAQYVLDGGAGELAEDNVAALKILFHWLLGDGQLLRVRAENACRLGRPGAAAEVARLAWAAAENRPALDEPKSSVRANLIAFLERYGISLDRKAKDPEVEARP